jgi:phosphate transport system substrate-binding protein
MSGASAAHPLVADLAFFYRREAAHTPRFAIVGGGTATGIADAARGVVDAGLTDRPPARGDPAGLQYTPVALSALCLVTNTANPVSNVTEAELQGIEWVGTEASRGWFASAPPARMFTTPARVRDHVLATPTAWGYVDLAYSAGLNVVAYEGIPCSPAAPYPARRELGFVTRGPPRGELTRFLRWVARDATARRVIATRYVIP